MHITEGMLSGEMVLATGALAAGAIAIGVWRMKHEEIPRVAVMSAVFFMASLIHVPIGPASAHLVLNGLMGMLLGWATLPAVFTALLLQAVFFGHGGYTTLGANVLVMGLPALVCWYALRPWLRTGRSRGTVIATGIAAGIVGIVLGCACFAAVLLLTGREFTAVVTAILIAHLPVIVIEAAVTAAALASIHQLRPELLPTVTT